MNRMPGKFQRRVRVSLGGGLAVLLLAAPSPRPQLLPVDEAATRPDFFTFRAHLQTAIARRDVEAVMAVVHPDIKNTFGGDDGAEAFRRLWRVQEVDSQLWSELAATLALGGTFADAHTFVAPYTFSRWPEQFDSFEHVALVAAGVRIRAAPRTDAPTIAVLSFAILPVARGVQQRGNESWKAVQLDGNRVGYVASQFARSPIDYRAIFSLRDGRWKLVTFIAGD